MVSVCCLLPDGQVIRAGLMKTAAAAETEPDELKEAEKLSRAAELVRIIGVRTYEISAHTESFANINKRQRGFSFRWVNVQYKVKTKCIIIFVIYCETCMI